MKGARSVGGPVPGGAGRKRAGRRAGRAARASSSAIPCGWLSGCWADRSQRYWLITILGYLVQMTVIPLLALAGSWQVAAALMVLERMGKATRNPPRDVMLSEAGAHMGRGWAFGVNEALDQIGAFLGPLAVAAIFALRGDYRPAFAWLAVPAVAVLLLVMTARLQLSQCGNIPPAPAGRAGDAAIRPPSGGMRRPARWWRSASADYALIAFHFAKSHAVSEVAIPVVYAFAMLAGGAGSLIAAKLYDRFGLNMLVPLTTRARCFAPLVFLGGTACGMSACCCGAWAWACMNR